MSSPKRLRRSRRRGWKTPLGAVYVGRPTRFGNPHVVSHLHDDASLAVARYRADLLAGRLRVSVDDVRRELRGKDLLCWCALDRPCHADVLLELAREGA